MGGDGASSYLMAYSASGEDALGSDFLRIMATGFAGGPSCGDNGGLEEEPDVEDFGAGTGNVDKLRSSSFLRGCVGDFDAVSRSNSKGVTRSDFCLISSSGVTSGCLLPPVAAM